MPVTTPLEMTAVAVAPPELKVTVGAVTYPDPPLVTLTAPTQVVHGSEAPVVVSNVDPNQIAAAKAHHANGFLLWNPEGVYTTAALAH